MASRATVIWCADDWKIAETQLAHNRVRTDDRSTIVARARRPLSLTLANSAPLFSVYSIGRTIESLLLNHLTGREPRRRLRRRHVHGTRRARSQQLGDADGHPYRNGWLVRLRQLRPQWLLRTGRRPDGSWYARRRLEFRCSCACARVTARGLADAHLVSSCWFWPLAQAAPVHESTSRARARASAHGFVVHVS